MSDVQEGKQIDHEDAVEVILSSVLCFAKLGLPTRVTAGQSEFLTNILSAVH